MEGKFSIFSTGAALRDGAGWRMADAAMEILPLPVQTLPDALRTFPFAQTIFPPSTPTVVFRTAPASQAKVDREEIPEHNKDLF